MEHLIHYRPFLQTLQTSNKRQRNAIIQTMNNKALKIISDISHNTLSNNTEVIGTPYEKKLKKFHKLLKALASKTISFTKKRLLLLKSGSFLKILIESLFRSIIGEIISQGV